MEVYFDDFKVTQTKSPIIQSDNYYVFGERFNSYTRENALLNKRLYNDGAEIQLDLSLNVYSTEFRMYDQILGRWWQLDPKVDKFYDWSPYNYSFNNPSTKNDPKGDCPPGVDCSNPLPQMQVRQNRASNLGPGNVRTQNGIPNSRPHHGHDLHAPTGTNVSSTLAGKVVSATNAGSNGYGNTVVVKSNIHPEAQPGFVGPPQNPQSPTGAPPEKTMYVQYSHLEAMNVATGAVVTSGQSVGTVGTSGNAQGMTGEDVHLHIQAGTSLNASGTSISNGSVVSPNTVYNGVSFTSADPGANQSTTGVIRTTTNAQGVQTTTTLQPNNANAANNNQVIRQ
jgi:RHS repeat-associated protein